jgi:hypothetical protein
MADPERGPGPQSPASPPAAGPSGRRTRSLTVGVLAVTVTVVAAAFWVASRPPGGRGGIDSPGATAMNRATGDMALAAIVARDGREQRRSGEISVYPGENLRVEVTLQEDREAIVGFVGENGVWTELLPKTRLTKGNHVCPEPLRFGDDPSSGVLVAGSPEAIEHARETDDFRGLTALRVRLETGDR